MPDTGRDDLDIWFAAARERPPVPDEAFLARLSADAARAAPRREHLSRLGPQTDVGSGRIPPRPAGRPAPRRRLAAGLGGWRGMSGLAAAALAGLWIGFVLPESMRQMAPSAGTDDTLDLFAAADGYFGEG